MGDSSGEVLVMGFNSFADVDYSEEITGAGLCLRRLSEFSEIMNGTVYCGVKTRILDIKHIGVAVCHKGRVVDVADRASNLFGDAYGTSPRIKVFTSKMGKVGVLVDTDCLLESNWQKTVPHADVMLCVNRGSSVTAQEEVRLYSQAYKIPYLYVDDQGVEWRGD